MACNLQCHTFGLSWWFVMTCPDTFWIRGWSSGSLVAASLTMISLSATVQGHVLPNTVFSSILAAPPALLQTQSFVGHIRAQHQMSRRWLEVECSRHIMVFMYTLRPHKFTATDLGLAGEVSPQGALNISTTLGLQSHSCPAKDAVQ